MKKLLVLIVLACLTTGCAMSPEKSNLYVEYPLKGEIIWTYRQGSTDQDPQFLIKHDDLQEFIQWLENEKTGKSN